MASNKLFSLFDEKLRSPNELVSVPAQSLSTIQHDIENSGTLLNKIRQFENVKFKVDYSDFSNFVFFNSALDYFNISGEKLINEYPYDSSRDVIEQFVSGLDGYETYLYNVWPKNLGYLNFSASSNFSYIKFEDVGQVDGVSTSGLLNPASKSFAVDFWLDASSMTGSNDCQVIFQKSGTTQGFWSYISGSNLFFSFNDGSTNAVVSCSLAQTSSYYSLVCDREQPQPVSGMNVFSLRIYRGDEENFPSLISSDEFFHSYATPALTFGLEPFYIGSGTISGKNTVSPKFSIDDVRFWKTIPESTYYSSSFNSKIFATDNLFGLWRFNEAPADSISDLSEASTVRDDSGKRINGKIINYDSAIRQQGSLLPYDEADLLRTINAQEVIDLINQQQASASLFDKTNDNQLTRMLPEQFFLLEEFKQTDVLKNFVYLIGRYFDQVKVSIDQFAHVLKNDYSNYNQTPYALLEDIGKFFGWQFTGNFLDKSAIQYIIGKNVLENTQANKQLDKKLYEIKNEFWKRTLINLMHLYKTKGTKESVESLMRIYGVNRNFVKLKEFGIKQNSGINSARIYSEKSAYALTLGSSASYSSEVISSPHFSGNIKTVETRLRFPTPTTSVMTASFSTGSIWTICSGTSESVFSKLYYTKDVASTTGSIIYSGSEGVLEVSGAPIFDNEWYNVAVLWNHSESSIAIDVQSIDRDEIDFHLTGSSIVTLSSSSIDNTFKIGKASLTSSQMWIQEARVWNQTLDDTELSDHALNFQSFGTKEIEGLDSLFLHWRLNENVTASLSGQISQFYDNSGHGLHGSGSGFSPSSNPYSKFLNEFNYIASPEFGWTDEKIRNVSGSIVSSEYQYFDTQLIALEFNVIDALNEDISQILSTLDTFNEIIGAPANRFRDSYEDLETLRNNYFNRLEGNVNFTKFVNMLEFFDRSFIDMIRRLIPARAIFIGDEVVVESHMLERPKLQWNYRRRDIDFEPEGRIKVFIR